MLAVARNLSRPPGVNLGPLKRHLVRASNWDDIYPAWQGWANECERLLAFVEACGQLQRFWPRLTAKKQQRDEALNELRVAHFLSGFGYPILGWEVTDAAPLNVEFEIGLGAGSTAFVEVKSPGWEGELGEAERKSGRAKQEKHVNLEARAADVSRGMPSFLFGPPGSEGPKAQPAMATYRVYLDGREELIRNAEIADINLMTFKEIVAASRDRIVYSAPFSAPSPSPFSGMMSFDPFGETDHTIVSFVMPSLLFEELTIKKPAGDFPKPPISPNPLAAMPRLE